jgi:hypothetical protein
MSCSQLQELEELAAKLLEAAQKLPPSSDCYKFLKGVGTLRAKLSDLRAAHSHAAHQGPNTKSKTPPQR